jgi:ankyrin repeat protein
MTPVHVAAAWGRVKILEVLLANGGDPLSLDSDNCSPFHYAFQGEHYDAVSILSKYCIKEDNENENLKFKLKLGKLKIIMVILDYQHSYLNRNLTFL